MKRFISLVLVLIMVTSGIVAFAEEAPTTEQKTPMVVYTLEVSEERGLKGEKIVYGTIEILGYEEKQPLIFQGTPEKPKTGFSRMSPEEIALLQEMPYFFRLPGSIDTWQFDTELKKALTEFEGFYTYTTKKDGTVVRKLKTEKFSETKNPIMSGGFRDRKNELSFSVLWYEQTIMFEQYAYSLIEDIVPIADIQLPESGSTSEKLWYMYDHMKRDTYCDNKEHDIARDVLRLKSKSKSKIEKDKKAVTEVLLNVIPGEDFEDSYGVLCDIFSWFGYKYDDGHLAIVVK